MNYYIPKVEPGIISKNGLYFYEPAQLAKEVFYYVLWGGEYVVNAPYSIRRDYMNSFIFFLIKKGSLHFHYQNQSFTASKDEIVLLDCKKENNYYATEETVFQFFHFNGKHIQELYNAIYDSKGSVYSIPAQQNTIPDILSLIESQQKVDFKISLKIYELLGNILESNSPSFEYRDSAIAKKTPEIEAALSYIQKNFSSKITVEKLSHISNLSTYHFSRLFKKHVGTSPHQYLLNYRLIQAKNLLVDSQLSIEQISIECGFYSTGHFINAFSKSTGMTPGKFRKTCF